MTDLLTLSLAVYIGLAFTEFFKAITRDLITPLFAPLFPGAQKSINTFTVNAGPFVLPVGDALAATLHLATTLFVVSLTLPYLRAYAPLVSRK
jgi:large-conductance mechanosensitive channel